MRILAILFFCMLALLLHSSCSPPSTPTQLSAGAAADEPTPEDAAKTRISVAGMTCDGCVRAITETVSELPGVHGVVVSLEEEAAFVTYDAEAVQPSAFVSAINAKGYTAAVAYAE